MATKLVQPSMKESHVSSLIHRTMKLQRLVPALNPSRINTSRLGERPLWFRPITLIKVAQHSSISGLVEDETLAHKKRELYHALEGINRGIFGIPSAKKSEIESLVKQLESQNPTPDPTLELEKVAGCWRLVYSTISILGSKRTKLGLRDFISLDEFFQNIDIAKSKAVNIVKFSARGLNLLAGQLSIEASFKIASKTRVDINFENSTITPDQLMNVFRKNYDLLLGIFNPEGWLEITYVDDSMRIGRDDKGNIFVLERFEDGIPKETALQALNTIIQLHFEKTLEKKRAIDLQKKELHKLFQFFFIFLSLVFLVLSQSQQPPRLQCRHCWIPITLLSMAHLIFYVSVAQTLRCINGFKYQKRCHKLTLASATEKLREIKMRLNSGNTGAVGEDDFEIHYQEPPESYFGKFKRNWALHFGFLILIYGFMVSSSVVLLCF